MNKSFMYANGNIHIFNEQNQKEVIPYTDNFIQRLISENLIESIDNVLENTNYNIDELNDKIDNINRSSIRFGNFCIMTGFITPFFLNAFLNLPLNNIDTIIGEMSAQSFYSIVYALFGLGIGVLNYSSNIIEIKKLEQKLNGYIKLNDELIIRKNNQKKLYSKLLEDHSKECEDELNNDKIKFQKIDIHDEYEKRNLQALIQASKEYGTNKKELIKYYNNNSLNDKMNERLLRSEIILIEQFIEEDKEKQMIKKKYKRKKY